MTGQIHPALRFWYSFIQSGMFITRLPLGWLHPRQDVAIPLGQTAMFFPLWGGIIAVLALLLVWPLYLLNLPWPMLAALLLLLGVLLSGGLHEDGLADCCDGFWGGKTSEDRHRIMKDPAIGSYGTLGLIFSIGIRWIGLIQFEAEPLLFLLMHTLPRGFLGLLWAIFPLRQGLATQNPDMLHGGTGLLLAILLGLVFTPPMLLGSTMAVCGLVMLGFCLLALRKLGGLNGDCFGGAEQCGQIALVLVWPALF